jgi:hypothetical protein
LGKAPRTRFLERAERQPRFDKKLERKKSLERCRCERRVPRLSAYSLTARNRSRGRPLRISLSRAAISLSIFRFSASFVRPCDESQSHLPPLGVSLWHPLRECQGTESPKACGHWLVFSCFTYFSGDCSNFSLSPLLDLGKASAGAAVNTPAMLSAAIPPSEVAPRCGAGGWRRPPPG